MTQGQFLEALGIRERGKILNTKDLAETIGRLINPDEMGKIYKVLEFSRK